MKLLIDYLRNRQVRTVMDSERSSWQFVEATVPKGSILGPVLFNIFVSDKINCIGSKFDIFQYADDCQILMVFDKHNSFSSILCKISHVFSKIRQWSEDNCLVLNDKKTQVLPIYNKNITFSKLPFFDETSVSFVSEAIYMGFSLSKIMESVKQYILSEFFWKDIYIRKKLPQL